FPGPVCTHRPRATPTAPALPAASWEVTSTATWETSAQTKIRYSRCLTTKVRTYEPRRRSIGRVLAPNRLDIRVLDDGVGLPAAWTLENFDGCGRLVGNPTVMRDSLLYTY